MDNNLKNKINNIDTDNTSNIDKELELNRANNSNSHNHGHGHSHGHDHGLHTSIYDEFIHHLPYTIFSSALALIFLSITSFISGVSNASDQVVNYYYFNLFHNFHLLHILFAASGTVLAMSKFSKNIFKIILVGILSPAFFCILSDIFMPYWAGKIIGVTMTMHICFICPSDSLSAITFLILGLINGLILRKHSSAILDMFSVGAHFMHILISALASLFYLISHGFNDWYSSTAYIFAFLVIAVIVPCTFSDVVVPSYFAGKDR